MPPGFGKKTISEEEKRQQQQQNLEQELQKLQQEYLILDQERGRSQLTGWTKLAKSNRVVNIFKAEYENLFNDLTVATSSGKRKEDDRQYETLQDLLLEHDDFDICVTTQKTYMVELEGQIRKVSKDVQALRKMQITDRQYQDRIHDINQTLERCENKLELQTTKFNVIVARNRELRTEIDHLLWDRRNFMGMWRKLIYKLTTGKQIMLDLIEQATIAYDQREEWCKKLQLLRMTGHREMILNLENMRRYSRHVDHAKKLQEFFDTKGQKRLMEDLEQKEKLKRAEQNKKIQTKLENYHNMMEDIIMFSHEPEAQEIARKCYRLESDNFMWFQHVIYLIGKMENMNDDLGHLHLQIDQQRALNAVRTDQQQDRINFLEKTLEEAVEVTRRAREDLDNIDKNLEALMNGTQALFKLCKCNNDPLIKLLGHNSTIKPYNVLLYLQILETTIQDLLIRVGYKEGGAVGTKKELKQKILTDEPINLKIYAIERIVPAHPCALCVQHEMVSDVIDKAQKVWTRHVAQEMLKAKLTMPDGQARVHTISKCHLPGSRRMMQQRYE